MTAYPLQGRTLFITGGASGIGAETARQAAQRGARVALVDVDGGAAESVAASLPAAIAIKADVRDYEALEAAAAQTAETFGGIDVCFANAGIEVDGTALATPLEKIEAIADINFTGVMRTVRATLPYVIERRGYVLITASAAALAHAVPLSHYSATKAGVEAFGDAMRGELAHKGVDVGVAYFGFIDTPMVQRGRIDPIFQEYEARYGRGGFIGKTYSVESAAAKVVTGIEARRRRVIHPNWLWGFFAFRAVLPRVIDATLERRGAQWVVDKMEERDRAASAPKERLLS